MNPPPDFVSWAGDLASIIGIPFALWGVWEARKAAKRSATEAEASKKASLSAQHLVEKSREDLKLFATVINLERALRHMEEIKSLIRHAAYIPVPDKISGLINILNEIRGPSTLVSDAHATLIQEAVVVLRKIEDAIDGDKKPQDNGVKFKRDISKQIDQIQPVLAQLKDKIGR